MPWTSGLRSALRRGGERVLTAIALLLIVSFLTFALLQLAPGDAATAKAAETGLTDQSYQQARAELGLDRPFLVQYGDWLRGAVQGDLGESLANGQPVTSLIGDRLPVTISLTIGACLVIVPLAILLGVVAAAFANKLPDRLVTAWASMAVAAPTFWVGLILLAFLAVRNGIFPATGFQPLSAGLGGYMWHLVLPSVTLAIPYSASVARQLRVSMIDALGSDYARAAEAKGMPRRAIIIKHALRNAAPPSVTLFGLELISLLGGAIVVEQVFALPGLGSLAIQSVLARDTTVIQGILLITCLIAVIVNSLVDVSYKVLDPRLRSG